MRVPATVLLILLLSGCFLLMLETPRLAQAQISPDVPQFSLKINDQSYDVEPRSTTDPFTGEQVKISDGFHVDKKFIDLIIENPDTHSFYSVVNESVVKLYYNIRVKTNLDDNWRSDTNSSSNLAPTEESNYTIVPFGYGSQNLGGFRIWLGDLAPGTTVDFQVRAIDGFYTKTTEEDPICWRLTEFNVFHETGHSGWSETQTITIPETPTATPTEPAATSSNIIGAPSTLPVLAVVGVTVAVLVTALFFRWKNRHS
ncbi:MAG: hypothetical protein NWE92_08790 [Candidatus Bathyarchaeota archaeon]|nr:hypothetical protein [Candidatus Bathyarchaeota archaeon]